MARKKRARGKWIGIAAAVVLTTFTVVLVLNLALGDKTVDQDAPSLYSTGDEQFTRVMSVMLGPPLVSGNRATTLVNGDRIFPAMLEALRSAKKTITFEMYKLPEYWLHPFGPMLKNLPMLAAILMLHEFEKES